MSYISEKVAYLDGLADGLGVSEDDKQGKLLRGIIYPLGAVAEELEEQGESLDDLSDCVDELYEQLDDVNDALFDEDDEAEEGDFMEVVCPSCGETIYFDEDMLDSEDGLICPNCNEPVEIDLSCVDAQDDGEDDD